jgi:polysaccharide biosynthesis/export protein
MREGNDLRGTSIANWRLKVHVTLSMRGAPFQKSASDPEPKERFTEILCKRRQKSGHSRATALLAELTLLLLGTMSLLGGEEPVPQAVSGLTTEARSDPRAKTAGPPAAADYVISPDDLLEVNVFDVSEFCHTYRVSPSGSITLPLVQTPIVAAGLTTTQLAGAIRDRLQADGLVSKAQVTVEVKESRLHSVAVTGAVKKPQIYPIFAPTTLLDVLSQAEGLAEDAGAVATITRGDFALTAQGLPGGQDVGGHGPVAQTITIDLKRLLQTGDPRLNIDLYPGDRVTVQQAGVIYVVGAVGRPGGFTLKNDQEQMTVLKAIALAEDLKSTAIKNRAVIIRDDPARPGLARHELPVNLSEVLEGRAPDPPMQANDILFVPDSTAKKAMRRAAEAAVQIATGVIIWR